MSRFTFLIVLFATIAAHAAEPVTKPATKPTTRPSNWGVRHVLSDDPKLPRVLLIGDSILGGYHARAAELLKGSVNLDCWITPTTINYKTPSAEMKEIFEKAHYDVILFNDIGLHAWNPGRIPDGQYEPLIRAHVAHLQKLAPGAKLIFATTTPMTTKTRPIEFDPEFNKVIVERNAIAVKVMEENKIPVADYYGLLEKKLDLAAGDKFHWSKPAYELLAQEGVAKVKGELGKP